MPALATSSSPEQPSCTPPSVRSRRAKAAHSCPANEVGMPKTTSNCARARLEAKGGDLLSSCELAIRNRAYPSRLRISPPGGDVHSREVEGRQCCPARPPGPKVTALASSIDAPFWRARAVSSHGCGGWHRSNSLRCSRHAKSEHRREGYRAFAILPPQLRFLYLEGEIANPGRAWHLAGLCFFAYPIGGVRERR